MTIKDLQTSDTFSSATFEQQSPKLFIQEMLEIHDYLYSDEKLIPQNAFDGKSKLRKVYVITDESFNEGWAYNYYLSQDRKVVEEELKELNEI
ncbi:hypothetical protein MKX83_24140 [Cytobacillus sp. FSL M8-0252]|uniref:hypothetical protein n=1 Tax=Cytobacillus sp. FSL M8-0252 TaxID=2921621 RepID=UPI0030FB6F23